MAISIETPKREEVEVTTSPLFILGAIIFLFLVVGSYFLLIVLIKNAQEEIKKGTELLKTGVTAQEKELETRVLSYKQKAQDIIPLLERHNLPSVFFESLEKATHPWVRIVKLSLDASKGTISLEGITENFESLAQQAELLKKEVYLEDMRFPRIQLTREGKISFEAVLDINLEIIKDKK